MSTELAIGLVVAAFILMGGVSLGILAVVLLDTVVAWPAKPRHRRPSPGVQFWARSGQADTAALTIAGWSR